MIKLTISDLILSNSLINHLAILSLNEELQDLNTKDLNCLIVNVLLAQLYLLLQTTTQSERKLILLKSNVTNYSLLSHSTLFWLDLYSLLFIGYHPDNSLIFKPTSL